MFIFEKLLCLSGPVRRRSGAYPGKRSGLLLAVLVSGLFSGTVAFRCVGAEKDGGAAPAAARLKIASFAAKTANGPLVQSLVLRNIGMRDFTRMLSKAWGRAIAVSEQANKPVSVFLENVDCETALRTVCRANGLWFRTADNDKVVFIETVDEYKRNAKVYNEQYVETVTLLYPSVEDIGETVKDLFKDQVVWTLPNQDLNDDSRNMEKALDRMDILAERGQFSLQANNGDNYNGGIGGMSGTSSSFNSYRSGGRSGSSGEVSYNPNRKLAEPRRRIVGGKPGTESVDDALNKPGVVYVAGMAASNTLILRSSDKRSLEQVKKLIKELDKPSPQVLLEVKVLELRLGDESRRGFDILFKSDDGKYSGGFANGLIDIAGGAGGNIIAKPGPTLAPRGTGIDRRAAVFNYVSNNVRARIQVMNQKGNLKLLSTPSLLVADNEASRIFVGTETTILTELQVESNTTSGNNPVTTYNYNPITQRRNLGTTLLITPKIHADDTVTIRVMQETSDRGDTQRVVYGSDQQGGQRYFDTTDINQRIVTTTVEAKTGQIIAIGGLVSEREEERVEGAPVVGDIPLIGSLFQRVTKRKLRAELLILIRPYVIFAPGGAQRVSDAFLKRISRHKTAKDPNHPELNVKVKDVKKKTDSKSAFQRFQEWLYPEKYKDKDRSPENAKPEAGH